MSTTKNSSSNTMSKVDLKVYVKIVAAVFSISSTTAFVFTALRLLQPTLFYDVPLRGGPIALHYFISGLLLLSSTIGFFNSAVVLQRSPQQNKGRNITTWLLLDSLFETSRVVYVFISEVVLKGKGQLQKVELIISAAQYLMDSFLYCQMILKH